MPWKVSPSVDDVDCVSEVEAELDVVVGALRIALAQFLVGALLLLFEFLHFLHQRVDLRQHRCIVGGNRAGEQTQHGSRKEGFSHNNPLG
ncbi:MAG: hypothetical protein IE886_06910 [Campylobacterales bacterium]|nr:hypothetical protein [Campylobacterales bacterium]